MAESWGEGIAMVRGNVGSGIIGCGDGGGVVIVRWLVITSSMISTAVTVGEVGVVMVVMKEGVLGCYCCFICSFILLLVLLQL